MTRITTTCRAVEGGATGSREKLVPVTTTCQLACRLGQVTDMMSTGHNCSKSFTTSLLPEAPVGVHGPEKFDTVPSFHVHSAQPPSCQFPIYAAAE